MTEVRFQPEPTFEAPVPIYVPGKGEQELKWTFKYRDTKEVAEFVLEWLRTPLAKPAKKKSNKRKQEPTQDEGPLETKFTADPIAYVMAFAEGWELDEEFTRENLTAFFLRYPKAALDVARVYYAELSGVRRKN